MQLPAGSVPGFVSQRKSAFIFARDGAGQDCKEREMAEPLGVKEATTMTEQSVH